MDNKGYKIAVAVTAAILSIVGAAAWLAIFIVDLQDGLIDTTPIVAQVLDAAAAAARQVGENLANMGK